MKLKSLFAIALCSFIATGCAGLTPDQIEQNKAVRNYHEADAKVIRKEAKLVLATAAAVAATSNVVETTKEINEAKKERKEAEKRVQGVFPFLKE